MDKKKRVNVDKAIRKAKIQLLIEKGRILVSTREELLDFPLGSIISYITNDDIFHSDGYLKHIGKKSFTVIKEPKEDADITKIKFSNVVEMYIGHVGKTKNDVISIHQCNDTITKYPVKIGDIVVYYGRNNMDMKRFSFTDKYLRMVDWYSMFGDYLSNDNDSE